MWMVVRIKGWHTHDRKHTRRGFSTNTPHLRLHLALAKIGNDTANLVIDKNICGLLIVLLQDGRYLIILSYLEVTVQHVPFVQVSHPQSHFVNHLQEVDLRVRFHVLEVLD